MKRALYVLAAFCLVLALLPALAPGTADSDMIMVVFDYEYLRDVTPETMPFLSGGVLYIYYADFARLDTIDAAYYNARLQQVRLFNINRQLTFDLSNSQTYDENGDKYEGLALWRDGRIFLPARTVRDKFDLYYSYVSGASPAPVAILYSQSAPLKADNSFLEETEFFRLNTIYADYQNYLKSLKPPSETGNNEQTTAPPPEVTTPDPEPELTYLIFMGTLNADTADILAALDAAGARAAFFIPPDSIFREGELLRQIYTAGHTIGLLLEDTGDVAESAMTANQLLKAVLFTKTRLICLSGGADSLDEGERDALIFEGYRLWDPTIVPQKTGKEDMDGQAVNQSVRSSLYRGTATSVIGLDHSQSTAEAISGILWYIANNNFSLLTMKEWDTPINRAGDVR